MSTTVRFLGMRLVAAPLALTLAGGCAPMLGPRPIDPVDPDLYVGTMGEQNRFEQQAQRPVGQDEVKGAKATPALFWTGTAMGAVGAAGSVSFGIAGAVMNDKIQDGFDDQLTHQQFDRYERLGGGFNDAMVASATIGVVGLALAAIVYGIDYNRCGPLAPERRRCRKR